MQLLRYIVRPLSPWGTPLRSDTLCGMLLWRMAERQGAGACRAAIEGFRSGNPPFAVSSALPLDTVSMPRLPPASRGSFRQWVASGEFCGPAGEPLKLFDALQEYKLFRKTRHLPVAVWACHSAALSLKPLLAWFCRQEKRPDSSRSRESVEPHVTINRESGTAAEGGLYFNRLTWFAAGTAFHIYARAEAPDALLELLAETGDLGFGRDASTGKGRFAVERDESFDPAPLEKGGPHSLLCSVCAAMNMSELDGWYAVEAKRGKAGPGHANPHKAPMLLLQEGSVLRHMPHGPYVLEGINADPAVVQVTQPLILPCHVVEEENHA
ncbi:RAMP superfamily CRISPR-associated protein [Desulfovibrio sp. ZJ369]|uniref:type III-A CRISPR-associated RAMP protein Csm4 n=1 Tax=Desulfovibrio sp. ZJ369 TaxID=2709793 RepID=UPI0013ED3E1A|nr:RAMP superfamily CRISPR-associated protein [Desulfovibrio sp. ZJ369]